MLNEAEIAQEQSDGQKRHMKEKSHTTKIKWTEQARTWRKSRAKVGRLCAENRKHGLRRSEMTSRTGRRLREKTRRKHLIVAAEHAQLSAGSVHQDS